MKTIKFFHPEDTFTYHIEKSICKVVFSGKQTNLLIEIHSDEDLEHVEADSLQNEFPQLSLFIDDFPVDAENVDDLVGKVIQIPNASEEIADEEGEISEIFYTTVKVGGEDYDAENNVLKFIKDENGHIVVKWKGQTVDFTDNSEEAIPFLVECAFIPQAFDDQD